MKNKLMLMLGIVLLVFVGFAGFVNAAFNDSTCNIGDANITIPAPNAHLRGIVTVSWFFTCNDCNQTEPTAFQVRVSNNAGSTWTVVGNATTPTSTSITFDSSVLDDDNDYGFRLYGGAKIIYTSSFDKTIDNSPPNQPTLNNPANNSVVYDNQAALNLTVTDDLRDYLNVSFYNDISPIWEYQEDGNETSISGTWVNGGGNLIDGNWTTSDSVSAQDGYGQLLINYTKPSGVFQSSLWQIGNHSDIINLTIPSSCFSQTKLQVKLYYQNVNWVTSINWSCYNGTDWETLRQVDTGNIYEEGIWWNYGNMGSATNISNSSYATYNWTGLADGDYEWYATITDGTDTTTSTVYSFSVYDYNYTTSYTTPVLETSSQTFTLNITRDPAYIDDGNATLHWNGTDYAVNAVAYPTYLLFSKTFTIPSVNNQTNITFNWTYEFWNPANNSRETNRTEDFTQLIYKIGFDDCSVYSIVALNFSLIEESNNASIAGDMDFTFSLVSEGTSLNYSKSVTGVNSTAFCISTNNLSFTAQLQSEYTATDYDGFTYFAYDMSITNTTQYIYYYLTNGTTIVEFTVLDQSSNKIEDAYIKVMKYDIGTGLYKTTEVLKTDEQGTALGNIVLDTAWYKFIVEYLGVVYLDTSATKMTSTTRTFTINLLSDFFNRYTDVIYNIYSTLNFTEATGNFAFTYSDPSGDYHYGCLKVEKVAAFGNTLINETCVASTATTILVNIHAPGSSVNGTYIAVGYILFDDKYVLNILTKTWGHLSDEFGIEGLFYAFFILLTCVMVGIFNPKLAIILGMIGLVVTNILGFIFIELSWFVVILLAAGLTLYRMRDN